MILPDVNVLVYAFRRDAAEHEKYRLWTTELVNGESAYAMSPQVLASVIRVVTHPRIWKAPSSVESAMDFANLLLGQNHCQIVGPGPRHWDIYCRLCRESGATGNLTQDAWLAALAMEHGCEWVTTDGDFGRFRGLRWTRL